MATFRFLSVTIITILLLSPFIRSRFTKSYKPIIAVLVDNSESMRNGLGKDTTLLKNKIEILVEKLGSKYDVVQYTVGDELRKNKEYNFSEKSTDLSTAFNEINNTYYNQNIGAVVLASDGIFNKGANPVYAVTSAPYSIYSIAVGDTTVQRDQKITAVYYNKIVYLNDDFVLKADVEANEFSGKATKVGIYEVDANGERLLQTKDVAYNTSNFFQAFDFTVSAIKPGVLHYRFKLNNLDNEKNYRNNVRDIFIEVLDGRQKILLLANSAHPDLTAIKSAIESNKNYKVEIEFADKFSKPIREYDLVVLHQLPSSTQRVTDVFKQIRDLKKSVLFVIGTQTLVTEFQKVQSALLVNASSDRTNEVTAAVNTTFNYFTLSDKTKQAVAKLPPLSVLFGDFKSNPAAQVLFNQKINNITTDFPLWVLNETGEAKTGVIAGEGFWRWRLYDYLLNKNQDATNESLGKTIQFLSTKSDKRPFRVALDKNVFSDNEAVIFDAQVYNANFELVNTADVDLKITDEKGVAANYKFNKTESAYQLNAGSFVQGNYAYSATVKFGNSTLNVSGKFSVSPLQLEDSRTRADYLVMYQLASQHNGTLHYLNDAEKIADEIESKNQLKPVLYDTFSTESAIQLKWILALLLLLISAEWFLRKYLGGY